MPCDRRRTASRLRMPPRPLPQGGPSARRYSARRVAGIDPLGFPLNDSELPPCSNWVPSPSAETRRRPHITERTASCGLAVTLGSPPERVGSVAGRRARSPAGLEGYFVPGCLPHASARRPLAELPGPTLGLAGCWHVPSRCRTQ
jgi:hypothetical protein